MTTPAAPISTDVLIVGAGPIGLELAVALQRAGIDYRQVESGQVGQTIMGFSPNTRFFSSPERIAIAGMPIQNTTQTKCTGEEYLAYLRSVVLHYGLDVRTYERVTDLTRSERGGFEIRTCTLHDETRVYHCRHLVLATGGTARPRRLGIPGEDAPHVHRLLQDPHVYFGRRVLVIGGRNSAVEAALRCYHAGADVTIAYRGESYPERVKYWLRPEIKMLIETGRIRGLFRTSPVSIDGPRVTLVDADGAESVVETDFVLLAVGYIAEMGLFRAVGVTLAGEDEIPVFDSDTMETDVPGVFVAGTAIAGTQSTARYRVYIENTHVHVPRIVNALTGAAPPGTPTPLPLEES